ncbi:MAG: hypothetical protein IJX17_07585 [Clostridia bacterium]|nr:hypothetical protein [Clostridia bacterium]
MSNEESLDKFLYATDNILSSKFILIDRNISILLHATVNCEMVYSLIANCMINFDFVEEWKNATQENILKFPDEVSKKIAFIFCMLNNIDDRKLDITKVLEHYFSYDADVVPYDLFCKKVIVDFRNSILGLLNIYIDGVNTNEVSELDKETPVEKEEETKNETKIQMDKMLALVYKLKDEVRKLKKIKKCSLSKTDVIAIISTLEFAIKSNDLEYFYALVLSIKVLTNYNKILKEIVLKIEEISNHLLKS